MADDLNSAMLTESGHPVGQLVIADNTSVPFTPREREMEENREVMLREQAVELTGDSNADSAVAELFPGFGDADKRFQAAKLFVVEQMKIDDVAEKVGVPARTVSMWAYTYKWDALVKKELAIRQSQSMLELAKIRASRRAKLAEEQLAQAKKIRDAAMQKIESDETSVKSGAEAWAAAARVEHTLAGMSEAGAVVDTDGKEEDKKPENSGKQPLVMVFNGGLPPVHRTTGS